MKHLSLTLLCLLGLAFSAVSADITGVELFPVDFQKGKFAVTESYPYMVTVKPKGKVYPLHVNSPDFVITLPDKVKLIRATTRLVPNLDIPVKEVASDGKTRTYSMTLPCRKINITDKGYIWREGFNIYFEADKGSAGVSAPVDYHFVHKGEKLLAKRFWLTVLPEIPKARNQFRDFRISVRYFPSVGHPDTAILERQLALWKSFVADKLFLDVSWESYFLPEKSREMLKKNGDFFFFTWACVHSTMILQNADCDDLGFFVKHKVTRPGVPLFQDQNGKVNPGAICPQYLMRDPEGLFYGEYLRRGIAKAKKYFPDLKAFVIDYEPEVEKGTCDECRKDFARFAKLSAVPARDEIRSGQKYHRKWREYKVHQNKIIMDNLVKGVKKHYPDLQFSFCCTELRPSADAVNTWDAVDVAAMDSKTDFYSFMIYSTGTTYYDYLKYAADNLKHAKAFPWIDPAEESERFFVRYSPEKVRQNMVATLALNAMGLMFYPTDTMDGNYMSVIAGTADVLAGLEDIYRGKDLSKKVKFEVLNGRELKLFDDKKGIVSRKYPDLKANVKVHLHEKDGRYALSILNYADQNACLKIAIPGYKGGSQSVVDLIGKKSYTGISADELKKGFIVEIPAGGTSVIRISEKAENFPAVSRSALKKAIGENLTAGSNPVYDVKQTGPRISHWRNFKGKVMLNLTNGENYITVNPERNGRIEEWYIGQFRPVGQPNGALGEVQFYDQSQSELFTYNVDKIDLSKETPAVCMSTAIKANTEAGGAENPLAGLIMQKKIELDKKGNLIISDTFTNPSSKPMTLGFRTKSVPYSVWKAGKAPEVSLAGKVLTVPDGIYLKKGVKLNWYAAANAKELAGAPEVAVKSGRSVISLKAPEAAGMYFWHNSLMQTAEPLYAEKVLKPGEKYTVKTILSYNR